MWQGSRTEQIIPIKSEGRSTRAGVAVTTRPGRDTRLERTVETAVSGNKGISQGVMVRINETLYVMGMYIGPQISAEVMEETLKKVQGGAAIKTVVAGDLNARQKSWDRLSNGRGTALVK